jgi:hypothetical protein
MNLSPDDFFVWLFLLIFGDLYTCQQHNADNLTQPGNHQEKGVEAKNHPPILPIGVLCSSVFLQLATEEIPKNRR